MRTNNSTGNCHMTCSSKMASFSDDQEDELIELWRQRPCLYDCAAKGYSNRVTKNRALEEISLALGAAAPEIAKRIQSLRTQFCRLSKLPPSGSGTKKKTHRQEWLFRNLSFLSQHIKKRPSMSNLESQNEEFDNSEDEEDFEEADKNVTVAASTDNPSAGTPSVDGDQDAEDTGYLIETPVSTKRPLTASKRKRGSIQKVSPKPDIEEEFLKTIQKTLEKDDQQDDDLDIFGKNIVCKLRKILDPWTLVMVQNEIEQACFRGILAQRETRGPPVSLQSHPPSFSPPSSSSQSSYNEPYHESFTQMLNY